MQLIASEWGAVNAMRNANKTSTRIMSPCGWGGPGFTTYLSHMGDEKSIITAFLSEIDMEADSDPGNQEFGSADCKRIVTDSRDSSSPPTSLRRQSPQGGRLKE